MTQPLIELRNIGRSFVTGDLNVQVLKNINLTVNKGEFIAIIGTSGSGKSTLMNIMGGLDYPSTGTYLFEGTDIAHYSEDRLAELRREHFGFIFQRYHLLNTLTAQGNVEVPAIYSGMTTQRRHQRSESLLSALGLKERIHYYPNQLSGGQQQRVSIARALMNGGEVILADEPTGALDSGSGKTVLNILKQLNAQGQTIIMVTHDPSVARNASRIIELKDGVIISDRLNAAAMNENGSVQQKKKPRFKRLGYFFQLQQRLANAFKMAIVSMSMQRMRTFLTMLGIIIGIAAVVLVIAIGQGTTIKILEKINSMGTSTLTIYPGTGFGDRKADRIQVLRPRDLDVLIKQSYVESVTPIVATTSGLRYKNIAEIDANVQGVGYQYFDVQGYTITEGIGFDLASEEELKLEAVLGENTRDTLFPNGENPIGEVIMLDHLPVRIIGVATSKSEGMFGTNKMNVWLPYTSVMKRMLGQNYLRNITVKIKEEIGTDLAEKSISELMKQLHKDADFFIFNADTVRKTVQETTSIMQVLITSVGFISLLVGGIGVMNIMLVSVAERTREIGIRMAVGARKNDISQQFLIESVLVCLLGGVIGVTIALIVGYIFSGASSEVGVEFSPASIFFAFIASFTIGMLFGYFPAKKAAELAPIEALERA